jgi:hypothetical protein
MVTTVEPTTTQRLRIGARDALTSVRRAADDVSTGLRAAKATAPARIRTAADTITSIPRALPPQTVPELMGSVRRLRKVRTPGQAFAAFESETERLLTVVTPIFVEHPLPVRRTDSARALVATAGALAAAGDEFEELAAVLSGGAAVPPTLPVVLAANLVALALEVYVVASLRVHDLVAAGVTPDPHEVARDVMLAMTGSAGTSTGPGRASKAATKKLVRSIVTRVLSRWGASLVPFVGIAYSGWDAQRSVDAVRSLPLPAGIGPAGIETRAEGVEGREPQMLLPAPSQ